MQTHRFVLLQNLALWGGGGSQYKRGRGGSVPEEGERRRSSAPSGLVGLQGSVEFTRMLRRFAGQVSEVRHRGSWDLEVAISGTPAVEGVLLTHTRTQETAQGTQPRACSAPSDCTAPSLGGAVFGPCRGCVWGGVLGSEVQGEHVGWRVEAPGGTARDAQRWPDYGQGVPPRVFAGMSATPSPHLWESRRGGAFLLSRSRPAIPQPRVLLTRSPSNQYVRSVPLPCSQGKRGGGL